MLGFEQGRLGTRARALAAGLATESVVCSLDNPLLSVCFSDEQISNLALSCRRKSVTLKTGFNGNFLFWQCKGDY